MTSYDGDLNTQSSTGEEHLSMDEVFLRKLRKAIEEKIEVQDFEPGMPGGVESFRVTERPFTSASRRALQR